MCVCLKCLSLQLSGPNGNSPRLDGRRGEKSFLRKHSIHFCAFFFSPELQEREEGEEKRSRGVCSKVSSHSRKRNVIIIFLLSVVLFVCVHACWSLLIKSASEWVDGGLPTCGASRNEEGSRSGQDGFLWNFEPRFQTRAPLLRARASLDGGGRERGGC